MRSSELCKAPEIPGEIVFEQFLTNFLGADYYILNLLQTVVPFLIFVCDDISSLLDLDKQNTKTIYWIFANFPFKS
jgi:hypothetical protein